MSVSPKFASRRQYSMYSLAGAPLYVDLSIYKAGLPIKVDDCQDHLRRSYYH